MREQRPGSISSRGRDEARTKYKNYMSSSKWFARRKQWEDEALRRAGTQHIVCAGGCGKRWTLQDHLHHNTYERLENEAHEDLWGMCKTCHYRLHEIMEAKAWRRKPEALANSQALEIVQAENDGTAGDQRRAIDALGASL